MRLISPITVHPPELQSSTGGWGSYGTDDVVVDRHAGEMKGSGTTARLLGNNNNNNDDERLRDSKLDLAMSLSCLFDAGNRR